VATEISVVPDPADSVQRVMTPLPWWREAVTYQLYIRSFADGNGDGLGDIVGIRSRLGHLADLGVDAVWVNPWYPSPQADGGYDVADYRQIEPVFGTLDEARQLIEEAHELGLRVILDIVPNHTSDEHVWFQTAIAAGPGSPERARYLFRPGKGRDGALPPNNWKAVFGGSAWERVTEPDGTPGEWYLHLFHPKQPDLNWEHPQVREEFLDILRFWFDRGADGFRIDVAHGLLKDPALTDLSDEAEHLLGAIASDNHPHWDLPGVHEIYRAWRLLADSYDPPKVYVAEAWVANATRLAAYLRPDELNTAFDFDFVRAGWNAAQLRSTAAASIAAHDTVGAPVMWVLSNHDIARHVTRLGRARQTSGEAGLHGEHGPVDVGLGRRRARAALLLELALPGGVYLYQARNSAWTRWRTSPRSSSQTRPGSAPGTLSVAATAAGCRCRGPVTVRRSGSGQHPGGSRSRRPGPSSASNANFSNQTRCSRSTARHCDCDENCPRSVPATASRCAGSIAAPRSSPSNGIRASPSC
jgi:alpha-glucosidase